MSNLASKGILLIAVGHPYYGRMAFNLAMTIKAVEPEFKVAIVYNNSALSHLSDKQKKIFDESMYFDDANGFGAKLYMDLLTPFEETLFLDADMAWMPTRKPSELFNELKDVQYTGITEGYYDVETNSRKEASQLYYFWAEPEEILQKYEIKAKKIYQWRSEVIYFKNTDLIHEFFLKARQIHDSPGLSTVKDFAGQIPDELGINISAAMHEIEPHEYKWMPALWIKLHGSRSMALSDMYGSYYLLSCGSNHTSGEARKIYDRIVKTAAYKQKMEHVFPLINKRDFIPERQKM